VNSHLPLPIHPQRACRFRFPTSTLGTASLTTLRQTPGALAAHPFFLHILHYLTWRVPKRAHPRSLHRHLTLYDVCLGYQCLPLVPSHPSCPRLFLEHRHRIIIRPTLWRVLDDLGLHPPIPRCPALARFWDQDRDRQQEGLSGFRLPRSYPCRAGGAACGEAHARKLFSCIQFHSLNYQFLTIIPHILV